MREWRLGLFILAVLSFVLAGARSMGVHPTGLLALVLDGWYFQVSSAIFFWIGVVSFLVAAWGRGT
jgi:uncharacterized ion transporter superfamily protein YfcC